MENNEDMMFLVPADSITTDDILNDRVNIDISVLGAIGATGATGATGPIGPTGQDGARWGIHKRFLILF